MPLNIGGRICVYYSIFWGFLSIYLLASVNPKVDRLINWIKSKFNIKTLKTLTLATIIVLLIDCIITGFAIEYFLVRMIHNNDIQVAKKDLVEKQYVSVYEENKNLSRFIYQFWGDRKMIKTFPNLKLQDVDGNIIYMDSFLDIQPYYFVVHEKNS